MRLAWIGLLSMISIRSEFTQEKQKSTCIYGSTGKHMNVQYAELFRDFRTYLIGHAPVSTCQSIRCWIRSATQRACRAEYVDRLRPTLLCAQAMWPGQTSASPPPAAPEPLANSGSSASHHPVHRALRRLSVHLPAR